MGAHSMCRLPRFQCGIASVVSIQLRRHRVGVGEECCSHQVTQNLEAPSRLHGEGGNGAEPLRDQARGKGVVGAKASGGSSLWLLTGKGSGSSGTSHCGCHRWPFNIKE